MLTIQSIFPVISGLVTVGILLIKKFVFDKSHVGVKSVILRFLYGPMILAGIDSILCTILKKPIFYARLGELQVPIALGGLISIYFGLYLLINEINTPSHPEEIRKENKWRICKQAIQISKHL